MAVETVNVKYLKDNGNVVSPVVSSQSVYRPDGTTLESFLTNNNYGTYSFDEIRVGTWVDGKPLYRKVLYLPTITFDATWTEIQHGIPNIDRVVYKDWFNYNGNTTGTYFTPLCTTNFQYDLRNFYFASRTTLTFAVGSDGVGSTRTQNYIILEYTKTTDS